MFPIQRLDRKTENCVNDITQANCALPSKVGHNDQVKALTRACIHNTINKL